MEYVLIAVAILVVALITGISLLVGRGRQTTRLDSDAAAGTTLTRPRPPIAPDPTSGATAADVYTGPPAPAPHPEAPEAPV
jgi:fused signal recognition particle receptor